MIPLGLELPAGQPLHLLCIGAHADDLEIGCGGTVHQMARRHPGSSVLWWVLTGNEARQREAREAAHRLLGSHCELEVRTTGLRDGFLPYDGPTVKEAFEAIKERDPDLILTHSRGDFHQDHRTVGELTWNTWRNHLILEYEVPKYDGDLGRPNCYVPLDPEDVEAKLAVLTKGFASQRAKPWYSEETFRGLLRIRGVECRAASGFAEAFFAAKFAVRL